MNQNKQKMKINKKMKENNNSENFKNMSDFLYGWFARRIPFIGASDSLYNEVF